MKNEDGRKGNHWAFIPGYPPRWENKLVKKPLKRSQLLEFPPEEGCANPAAILFFVLDVPITSFSVHRRS